MVNLEPSIKNKQLVPIVGMSCGFIFTITGYLGFTKGVSKILDIDNNYIKNVYYLYCSVLTISGLYMIWYFNEYSHQV
jgi:hypothetical protein